MFRRRGSTDEDVNKSKKVWQGHLVAASGEFVGTFMFLYFAFAGTIVAGLTSPVASSTQGGNKTTVQIWYICVTFGLSLLAAVWCFYRISGGLFNPAVTLALIITGNVPPLRGLLLLPAQLLGAIVAAALVSCMFPGDVASVKTTLSPGTSIAQGVFIEMFLTCQLTFAVLMIAAEKSKDTFIAPVGIGLAFFVAELAGVYFTGGSLNPARSFAPCVVAMSFEGYHWIYWIGPLLGSLITSGYYKFVKAFDYEDANQGQDNAGGDFGSD